MRSLRLWIAVGALVVVAGAVSLSAGVLSGGPDRARAGATVTVNVGDDWFCDDTHDTSDNPCVTSIDPGAEVQWVWVTGSLNQHSTTSLGSGAESWDSNLHSAPHSYSHVFTTPGSYSYVCIAHNSMRGTIIVGATPIPTGIDSPTPTNSPAPALTATPTPTTPPASFGDANKDGSVNSIDAALVLQYSAGLTSSINPRADANYNGSVDAIDATLILQYVAGLISQLPP